MFLIDIYIVFCRDAIEYHVDIGNIYSTIDENHYKSACNGWKFQLIIQANIL